ncbi:MAG: YggT family protein [Bradymonadia bacterium]
MIGFIASFLSVVSFIVIIDAVLSWVMPINQFPRDITSQLTAPLYAPIRAIADPEKMGGMDISPIILLVLIHLIRGALISAM